MTKFTNFNTFKNDQKNQGDVLARGLSIIYGV